MIDEKRRQALQQELQDDYDDFFGGGRFNNIADVTLTVVAVIASLAASVLAGTPADTWLTAGVAAVPAAVVTLQSKVDVRGRSVWYFQCAAQVSSLITLLKYGASPDIEDIVKRRADMEATMEAEWSQIGRSSSPPSKKRSRRI